MSAIKMTQLRSNLEQILSLVLDGACATGKVNNRNEKEGVFRKCALCFATIALYIRPFKNELRRCFSYLALVFLTMSILIESADVSAAEAQPKLLITPLGEVTEGNGVTANFLVVAETSEDLSGDYTISVTVSETGNYLASSVTKDTPVDLKVDFIYEEEEYWGTLALPIHDDDVPEVNGTVKVVLHEVEGRYSVLPKLSMAEVSVSDDDLVVPELSITGGEAVVEGDNAQAVFTVTANPAPNLSDTIRVSATLQVISQGSTTPAILEESGQQEFDLTFSNDTAKLRIPLVDNNTTDGNAKLRVTLNEYPTTPDSNDKYILGTKSSADVTVIDNESHNVLSVSSPTVDENAGTMTFSLTLGENAGSGGVSIAYVASGTASESEFLNGDYSFDSTTQSPILIASGSNSGVIVANITDDTIDENDETVILRVTANIPGFDSDSVTATGVGTITDNDSSPILIVHDATRAKNGGKIRFKVTLEKQGDDGAGNIVWREFQSGRHVAVNYSTSDGTATAPGDYTAVTSGVVFEPGETVKYIEVSIADDSDTRDETFMLVFRDEYNATVMHRAGRFDNPTTGRTATGTIRAMEVPTITLTSEYFFFESDASLATYYVVSDRVSSENIEVVYEFNYEKQNGEYFYEEWEERTVIIDAGKTYASISKPARSYQVRRSNQSVPERGDLRIRLVDLFDGYSVGTPGIFGLPVSPSEAKPQVRIEVVGEPTVVEGGASSITFRVSSVPTLSSGATISGMVHVTQSGNFIDSTVHTINVNQPVEEAFSLTATNSSHEFSFSIDDDEVMEGNGSITATVQPAGNFVLGTYTNAVSVNVVDDDSLPRLAIESALPTTAENAGSGKVQFTIVSQTDPGGSLVVSYTSSETGNFLNPKEAGTGKTATVNFSDMQEGGTAGPFKGLLELELHNDTDGESTGTVTVELDEVFGPSYRRHSTDNSASVMIYDDDAPELTLSNGKQVVESDDAVAVFTVSAKVAPKPSKNPITVTFTPSTSIAGMLETEGLQSQNLTFTGTTASLRVTLNGNETADGDAVITATLENDPDTPNTDDEYTVGTPFMGRVTVIDDESQPVITKREVISIETPLIDITEGKIAQFIINSTDKTSDTKVNISISQVGDYIFSPIPNSVTLEKGRFSLSIPTLDNKEVNDYGSITLHIQADTNTTSGYQVQSEGVKTIIVSDNDKDASPDDTAPYYSVASAVINSILRQIPHTQQERSPVRGIPVISITEDTSRIEEGNSAKFTLTASIPVRTRTKVNIGLSAIGDFLNGVSETTAYIEPNELNVSFAVATVDDNVAKFDGAITAQIRDGGYYIVGTNKTAMVIVLDASDGRARQKLLHEANQTVISQLSGLYGASALKSVSHRISQAFSEDAGTSIELGGNSTFAEFLNAGVETVGQRVQHWQKVLGDSSFEVGLFPEEGATSLATIWGLGDYMRLDDSKELDGDMFTGHIGLDAVVSEGVVAGLTTSVFQSDMDYESGNNRLAYESLSTGIHPYIGFVSPEGDRLQVNAGYGLGEIKMEQVGYETEILDSSFFNLGVEGGVKLYSSENLLNNSTNELNVNGESWVAGQFVKGRSDTVADYHSDGRHLRVSALGTQTYELGHGAAIIPEVSLSLREDGWNRQSFIGIEMGAGFDYNNPIGFAAGSNGSLLMTDFNQVHKFGVSGHLKYDFSNDRSGLLFDMTTRWVQFVSSGNTVLWDRNITDHEFDSGIYSDFSKVDTEVGYGFNIWGDADLLTPYSGINLTQINDAVFRFGAKLNIDTNMEIRLEGSRKSQKDGIVKDDLRLFSSVKW